MTRRDFLRIAGAGAVLLAAVLSATGCGGGLPDVSFDDAREITRQTLRELLLGQREESATRRTPPDPPLLRKGVYETVLLSADAAGFARISGGAISADAVREAERQIAGDLNKDLAKQGFSARTLPFGQRPEGAARTLLVTLTPTTEQGGSPRERAEGKNKTFVLVRLTVTDAAGGAVVRQMEYYSGRDVKPAPRKSGR